MVQHMIADESYDLELGARPMRRAVQRVCEDAITQAIVDNRARPGDTLRIQVEDDALVVKVLLADSTEEENPPADD